MCLTSRWEDSRRSLGSRKEHPKVTLEEALVGIQASDGLLAVSALIGFLAKNPAALGSETQPVVIELRQYQRVLRKAALRGLRWHLAVSWR